MSDSLQPPATITGVMQEPAREGNAFTRKIAIRGIGRALAQPVTYLGVVLLVSIYCTLAYLLIADRKGAFDDAVRRGGNIVNIFVKPIRVTSRASMLAFGS